MTEQPFTPDDTVTMTDERLVFYGHTGTAVAVDPENGDMMR